MKRHPLHAAVAMVGIAVAIALAPIGGGPMAAETRDEAEVCAWVFAAAPDGWSGLVGGKPGPWPVREGLLRATASAGKPLLVEKRDLRIDAGRATVVQITADTASATKGRLWFTTGVSPIISRDKMIEWAIKPGEGLVEHSFDLAQLPTWKDDILRLRFEFLGVQPDDEVQVKRIRLLHGDTISTPVAYTPFTPGLPPTLVATGEKSGATITLANVVVGDVWLAGGQSNMGSTPFDNPPPDDRRAELLETDYPAFRVVSIPTLNRETPLANDACEDSFPWRMVDAQTRRGLSAVGYYFGQAIHASQRIPVGLIMVVKAGSQVEQWLDHDTLHSLFDDEQLHAICGGTHLASGLHNGMIAPLAPFPIRGAVWYQGESNSAPPARCDAYARTLPALVRSWRRTWGDDLPVCIVQLPAFETNQPDSWPLVREVQLLCSQHMPGVSLAVTFDEGDPKNLHPFNKYTIGTRLALAARAGAYGEKIAASGPLFIDLERRDRTLVLRFDRVAEGLVARGDLDGFEIRGSDDRWLPATAAISGTDQIMLTCPDVAEPRAARYAWANAPRATLFNAAGLPASPFRSDVPVGRITAVTGQPPADRP